MPDICERYGYEQIDKNSSFNDSTVSVFFLNSQDVTTVAKGSKNTVSYMK
jgi:hypothetical protein